MMDFLGEHWPAIVAALVALEVAVYLVRKADPFPPSILDTKEGREAFIDAFVAQLPGRAKKSVVAGKRSVSEPPRKM